MKPVRLLYYFSVAFLLPLFSCFKDNEEFIPDYTYQINSEILAADLVGVPSSSIITLQGNMLFSLNEKVKLEIPEDALKDNEGNIIRGKIKVEFKEYTSSKGDFIFSPATITNNEILNAKKIIYLNIFHNENAVVYNKPVNIYLESDQSEGDHNLYMLSNGEEEQNWVPSLLANTLDFGKWNVSGSKESITGYKLTLKQEADWLLIGSSLGIKSNKNITLQIENNPNKFNNKNTLAYFVSDPPFHVNFRLNYDIVGKKFYTDKSIINKQLPGKIVTISQFGKDQFEFGMTNAILNKDTQAKMTILPKTIEEIKASLKAL